MYKFDYFTFPFFFLVSNETFDSTYETFMNYFDSS